jgi:ABC-type lipoprotein export system ATPase subunit
LNTEGTTIIQVTHSEANAAYGHRIIRLKDGWLLKTEEKAELRKSSIAIP